MHSFLYTQCSLTQIYITFTRTKFLIRCNLSSQTTPMSLITHSSVSASDLSGIFIFSQTFPGAATLFLTFWHTLDPFRANVIWNTVWH